MYKENGIFEKGSVFSFHTPWYESCECGDSINQHYFSVKTIVTTFALSLALCAAAGATAQTASMAPAPAADSTLLSETTDGDYIVRRYMVKNHGDADYTVRYQINLAMLNATLNGNSKQLDELNAFVGNLMTDTLMHVRQVTITGYSSPDGPVKFNEALAARRARDFKTYVDKKYNFSKKFDVKVNSVAEDWEMCRALVAQSQIPDRQAVLNIIDGNHTPDQKEMALKKMPAAWDFMKKNILPPLRRVELTIAYGDGSIVEQRTLIPKPKPAPAPVVEQQSCDTCPCEVVDEAITGIIVEMPETGHEYRKEMREERREITADERQAQKIAKREIREAKKIERQELKAARKIAKKEAKAAKKAEKAARKTYKDLEKM